MRVLFVSKPAVPPFHDGARCLVRDVATHLQRATPTVLLTRDGPALPGVDGERIYLSAGSFAPRAADNALVLARLLTGPRHDLWHFVFAPNPASSHAARLAISARRMPSVQTVASVPRSFAGSPRLLFGDRVVCLSASTRDRLVGAGADAARLEVIPPPLPPLPSITDAGRAGALRAAGIDAPGPLVLYPGDLEFSTGAASVARVVKPLLAAIPEATVVFACRAKTAAARDVEERLRQRLAEHGPRVAFVGEVPSLPPLLAASAAVIFPVDDLYGKVDLPIALLEAMALGVPVIVLAHGPLRELAGAVQIGGAGELAGATISLLRDEAARRQAGEEGRAEVARRHDPRQIAAAYEEVYRSVLGGA